MALNEQQQAQVEQRFAKVKQARGTLKGGVSMLNAQVKLAAALDALDNLSEAVEIIYQGVKNES